MVQIVFVCRFLPTGVFRALAGFRKISIGGFQHWVLIAVPKLPLHGSVALLAGVFFFQRAFEAVLISFFCQECLPEQQLLKDETVERTLMCTRRKAFSEDSS